MIFTAFSYYGIDDFSPEGMTTFLQHTADKCVDELEASSCIELDETEGTIIPTRLGHLASKYYLHHLTMRHFATHLTAQASVEELLKVLADCPEYEEIPVRHNENHTNRDLQRLVPLRLDDGSGGGGGAVDWESPHTKTHLLYQAHFSRATVPVDYATDQLSVLESCIRILQALLDFCMVKGWLRSSTNAMILQQQMAQARWYWDHPLLCLPHLREHSVEGIGWGMIVPRLQLEMGVYGVNMVPEGRVKSLALRLMQKTILEEAEAVDVIRALVQWPLAKLSNVVIRSEGANAEIPMSLSQDEFQPLVELQCGELYRLRVRLEILGPNRVGTTHLNIMNELN